MSGRVWMFTSGGKRIHPLNPKPSEIDIECIAHALSNLCRFTGHIPEFYSVAQHSFHVSHQVPVEDAMWGLLHDAAEAYVGDLAAPVKRLAEMRHYCAIEDGLLACIAEKFALPFPMPPTVVRADRVILATEFRDLHRIGDFHCVGLGNIAPARDRIMPVPPKVAKRLFLNRFDELSRYRSRLK